MSDTYLPDPESREAVRLRAQQACAQMESATRKLAEIIDKIESQIRSSPFETIRSRRADRIS